MYRFIVAASKAKTQPLSLSKTTHTLRSFHSSLRPSVLLVIIQERMFTKAIFVAIPAFLAFLISNVWLVDAFPKISAVGNKFFTDEGKQFYIKGTYRVFEIST